MQKMILFFSSRVFLLFFKKNEKHNVFTEEINKIALSSNDDKRMQSISSIEINTYETSKVPVSEKEEIRCNNKVLNNTKNG